MEEKEIIRKLEYFRKIKPEKRWVFLTKKEILGENWEIFPFLKPVYTGLFLIFLLIGLLGISQKSLPGEPLYYIKKVSEKLETALLPDEEKPRANLELVNKRLEELKQIAENNDVGKLPSAINEFQNSLSQAKNNLVKSGKINKEILNQTLSLATKVSEVEDTLGTRPEEIKEMVQYLIEDFENRTLSEDRKEILEKAKEYFENENYQKALEELLILSYNQ